MSDILEGIKHVHNNGFIHNDVKLENILMTNSEYEGEFPIAKLCDFGLSHVIDQNVGKAHTEVKCGTLGYMAPEASTVITSLTF
jgi:serine/threonine protein kinase